MWFGTFGGGISKFDGYSFKRFTRKQGLRDNVITAAFEDSNHNLWVSTETGGVGILSDYLVYKFRTSPLDTVSIYKIEESRDGRIWFATYGAGIFVYNQHSLKQLTVEDGLSSNYVWDFYFSKDGPVWVGTHNGISILHIDEKNEGSLIDTVTDTAKIGGHAVYDILKDSDGALWFATNHGVTVRTNKESKIISEINNTPLGYTYSIVEDKEGNIWFGTAEKGIYRQFDDNKFYHITEKNGLSSNYIFTLYKDRNSNIWVGTNEDGVNLYKGDAFVTIPAPANRRNWSVLSLSGTTTGELWVGTDGHGLWKMPVNRHNVQARQAGLEGREVWVIEKRKNGNLLLLMGDNHILEYDGVSFENFNKKIGLIPAPFTVDLFVDSQKRIWIGTDEGLYLVKNGAITKFTTKEGLADNLIWEITEHHGQIWIATDKGLSIFDNGTFKNLTTADGLVDNLVSTVIKGRQNKMWIGTAAGISLLRRNPQSRSVTVQNIDANDGLPLTDIQLLQIDKNGLLWQGTNGGLQVFNTNLAQDNRPLKVGWFPLDNSNGLEFAHKAVFTDSHDIIWFGSTGGLVSFNPDKFKFPARGPHARITGLKINFQTEINLRPTTESNYGFGRHQTEFQYDQDDLAFQFSALNFKDPDQVQYRYRLKGFTNKWSEITTARQAQYTNLEPRGYAFEVQASNKYGVWGTTAVFAFSITPPFWNTYWFYLLSVCLIAGMGYMVFTSWLHYTQANNLKNLVDEKTQKLQRALREKEILIKEIHHRVKNNLAVISGMFELQLDHVENERAGHILRESQRRVLSISMIHEKLYQNKSLSEINFNKYITELVEIIAYSFSHLDQEISTRVEVDEGLMLSLDQGIPCGLIINEVVSNAYEHAFNRQETGNIDIILSAAGQTVTLIIKDNGTGMKNFDLAATRDSLGITLVHTLTQQLEGRLDIDSSSQGTTVTVIFQLDDT